jgi:hypothetical protein
MYAGEDFSLDLPTLDCEVTAERRIVADSDRIRRAIVAADG